MLIWSFEINYKLLYNVNGSINDIDWGGEYGKYKTLFN